MSSRNSVFTNLVNCIRFIYVFALIQCSRSDQNKTAKTGILRSKKTKKMTLLIKHICMLSAKCQTFEDYYQQISCPIRRNVKCESWRDILQMVWAAYVVVMAKRKENPVRARFSICGIHILIMLLLHFGCKTSLTIQCNLFCLDDSALLY